MVGRLKDKGLSERAACRHLGVDRAALAAYCQAYGRWAQAERAVKALAERDGIGAGLVVETKGGNMIQNPLVGVANRAMGLMMKAAA